MSLSHLLCSNLQSAGCKEFLATNQQQWDPFYSNVGCFP
uniref:Protein COBRA n=1 Tax=Rhizophora mucronata TaxID=61149 RepID=A0A2P2PEA1_RHIMU